MVERAATQYGGSLGFLHRKMNGLGFRSWPDRMFVGPGAVFFMELKRLGEQPTPQQAWMHEVLRAAGLRVYVCDDAAAARAALLAEARRIGLAKLRRWREEMKSSFARNPLLAAALALEVE